MLADAVVRHGQKQSVSFSCTNVQRLQQWRVLLEGRGDGRGAGSIDAVAQDLDAAAELKREQPRHEGQQRLQHYHADATRNVGCPSGPLPDVLRSGSPRAVCLFFSSLISVSSLSFHPFTEEEE